MALDGDATVLRENWSKARPEAGPDPEQIIQVRLKTWTLISQCIELEKERQQEEIYPGLP